MDAMDVFVTSWNQFLEDIFQAAELKAKSKGQAAYNDYLIPLRKDIVNDLKEDNSDSDLSKALQEEIFQFPGVLNNADIVAIAHATPLQRCRAAVKAWEERK